ncbi:FliM/FliN family flagellar motor switch protein [Liberibacter crescens]|nr:FliM/FliN family flagellar motor switch protein [Liberibacter crescens]AMC12439.1 hypothetical protein RL73_01100 [Liberibacter crescens]
MHRKNSCNDVISVSPILLARLTGKIGDKKIIEKKSLEFGQLYKHYLPKVLKKETDIHIELAYIGYKSGKFHELISFLEGNFSLCTVSQPNCFSYLMIACGNHFIIALLEKLLSAEQSTIETLPNRPLSIIETDLAKLILNKMSSVLSLCTSQLTDLKYHFEGSATFKDLIQKENQEHNEFSAAINMEIILDGIRTPFILIIPQEKLLKISLTSFNSNQQKINHKTKLSNQFIKQVNQLDVYIEARIELQTITPRNILHLSVGDVIPFMDKDDVSVIINANGKEIYSCELGRTGDNYTVRIKNKISLDEKT